MEDLNLIQIVLLAVWLMLPASLANPAAAIASYLCGSFKPIDFGKTMGKNRILGDGKTIEGFIYGVSFGIFVAIFQNYLAPFWNLPVFPLIVIFTLPVGSLVGDLIASFFKRRFNIKRGQALPLIDQLDFVFGAWLLTIIFDSSWFFSNFVLLIMIATLTLTPILHLLFNVVGYKLGVSKEPW